MSLDSDMNKAIELVFNATEATMRATAIKLYGAIMPRIPVDTGELRGNQRLTINTIPTDATERKDKDGSLGTSEANTEVTAFKINDTIIISNTAKHASPVENGTPTQQGQFFFKGPLQDFQAILESEARKNKV
jgi:hypothetical protein